MDAAARIGTSVPGPAASSPAAAASPSGGAGGGATPAAASAAGRDAAKLTALLERFVALDDVVAQELADVDWPWNLGAIEERIREYSAFSEKINAQLSARVMQNYNEFVQGMQQVQAVETELTLIGVLVKNGRRKLQERDKGLVRGSMRVTRLHKKAQRLSGLLATLGDFQEVVRLNNGLADCLGAEKYCEAIAQHAALKEALANGKFRSFPGLLGLREGLGNQLALAQQKLSDGLKVAAVSGTDFDPQCYEEILRAYSMMSSDQALSVGTELLRHVSECIVAVSRQCMLMFSCESTQESPSDWHRKAQLRDLCRSMDPTHFVDCTAKLYEHLCDFLYRHQFLCRWHEERAQSILAEEGKNDLRLCEVLREVLSELAASKRQVWEKISQQVSLVLLTLDFQYPALTEESFLHILHLTQTLIDEGDAFMAGYLPPRAGAGPSSAGAGAGPEGRRQWSAGIKNTLKSKANDYFQSLHYSVWVNFKLAYIEQDTWQRLPVARSYSLLRKDRLQVAPTRKDGVSAGGADGSAPQVRTAETNPFRNYKPEPLAALSVPEAAREGAENEIDEHALLEKWIGDSDSLPHEQMNSSMLSNSNRSPVVSSSTVELARILERYFRMMGATPQLAMDIFQSAVQLVEFYVHCMLCLFVQDRHLRVFFEDLDCSQHGAPLTEGKLQSRHEAYLLQRLCPDLRRSMMRAREFMSGICLPDAMAASLNLQAPLTGVLFLQVTCFPKLTSASSLCGLSERCVGVESVGALLGDLRELRGWLADLLPRSDKEAVDRFLASHEVVASQLRTFVLRCAASDILEERHVGRISLDHFSNTMQALKWEAKDFSQGSPGAPYLEQLRGQIDDLARRIPSAGGGSIPYATQRTVWGWMEVRVMQECAEVVAKCGRKKSQEALWCMAEDFQTVRAAARQNFREGTGDGAEDIPLLPEDHPFVGATRWEYLDHYLEAHVQLPSEVVVWCKQHPEYPYRLHKALIEYLHSNPKTQRQYLTDLEGVLAGYITAMASELGGGSSRGGL